MPVLVPISHRHPATEKKLCRRRRTRTRRGVQGRVTVSVQNFQVHFVGGQELEAAQEAFPVAGDVERGLAELVPFVDVGTPLLEQPPHLLCYMYKCVCVEMEGKKAFDIYSNDISKFDISYLIFRYFTCRCIIEHPRIFISDPHVLDLSKISIYISREHIYK